jgi:hypothetical protein
MSMDLYGSVRQGESRYGTRARVRQSSIGPGLTCVLQFAPFFWSIFTWSTVIRHSTMLRPLIRSCTHDLAHSPIAAVFKAACGWMLNSRAVHHTETCSRILDGVGTAAATWHSNLARFSRRFSYGGVQRIYDNPPPGPEEQRGL